MVSIALIFWMLVSVGCFFHLKTVLDEITEDLPENKKLDRDDELIRDNIFYRILVSVLWPVALGKFLVHLVFKDFDHGN